MPIEENFREAALQLVHEQLAGPPDARPLLSIVVCAYRHAQYIDACLASIDSSKSGEIELVVIDDGSPDDTLRRCIDFPFRKELPVRIYTKPNQGLTHSLRVGLGLARGRFMAIMASDDLYAQGGIDTVLQTIVSMDPEPDAVLCQATFLGTQADGRAVYGQAMQEFFDGTPQERVRSICTVFPKPMLLQATVFKTDFLRGLKPWSDGLDLDDWPAFIHLFLAEAGQGATVCYLPSLRLCKYRLHEGGMHNNFDRQLRITEQVAQQLVPQAWRADSLANLRLDWGILHVREGRWRQGLALCLSGLRASASWPVVERLLMRVRKPLVSRARAWLSRRHS